MSTWSPIENAPRDGTAIDLWVVLPGGFGKRLVNCRWGIDIHSGYEGWCEAFTKFNLERTLGSSFKITHWMPEPDPPQNDN